MAKTDIITRARRAAGLTNAAAAALLTDLADELKATSFAGGLTGPVVKNLGDEVQSLRADQQTTPQVMLIACVRCGNGVQPRHAHRGLCPACLARELDRAEAEITRLRNRTTTESR